MAIILTAAKGAVAYWEGNRRTAQAPAWTPRGAFSRSRQCAFARLSAFAANGNHAPTGHEGAVTYDGALDFLHSVAMAR